MQFKTIAIVMASLALAEAHKHEKFHFRRENGTHTWGDWPVSGPVEGGTSLTPVADATTGSSSTAPTTTTTTTTTPLTPVLDTTATYSETSSNPVADATASSTTSSPVEITSTSTTSTSTGEHTWSDWVYNTTSSTPVADASISTTPASESSTFHWEDWEESTTVETVETTITSTDESGSTTLLTTTTEITLTLTVTNTVYQTTHVPAPSGGASEGGDQGTLTKSGTTTTTITIYPNPTGGEGSDVPSAGGPGGPGGPGSPDGGDSIPSDETAGNNGGNGGSGTGESGCKPNTVTETTVIVSTITVTPTPAIPTFGNHKSEENSTPADLTKTESSSTSTIPANPTGFPSNGTYNGTWADWVGSTGFLTVSKYATETPAGWKP